MSLLDQIDKSPYDSDQMVDLLEQLGWQFIAESNGVSACLVQIAIDHMRLPFDNPFGTYPLIGPIIRLLGSQDQFNKIYHQYWTSSWDKIRTFLENGLED